MDLREAKAARRILPSVAPLNADSPVPLYHQLADLLQERIRAGEYPAGSKIPSEPELARTFGIGRPTVRQATELLTRAEDQLRGCLN